MVKYKLKAEGSGEPSSVDLSKLQRRAGINVTGVLDDATKRLFLIPRCGVLESEDEEQDYGNSAGSSRKKRFYLQGTYWKKKVRGMILNHYKTSSPGKPSVSGHPWDQA